MDHQLILLAQLIDAEDGDDVLQVLIALKRLLHLAGDVVMLFAHDQRVQDATGRTQRIDRREEPLSASERCSVIVASRWAKVVAGAGSV